MHKRFHLWLFMALMAGISLALILPTPGADADTPNSAALITGTVHDSQNQPVTNARVSLHANGDSQPLAEATTQQDGRFALSVTPPVPEALVLQIEHAHFQDASIALDAAAVQSLETGHPVELPDTLLQRRIDPSFWVATLIFVGMLALIAFGKLPSTLAALVGTTLLFAVSYLDVLVKADLFIFDFAGAIRYVDWNVVFLIMGMMIVIAVLERTGIFQWLAFAAYRISGGHTWLLLIILMLVTGLASAFLDNVTTMLLMAPISVQISLALGINPLALLMSELMASNVIGVSTLIGTPTNILIGSYARISFNDFLSNLTPGVMLAFLGLVVYCELIYWRELRAGASSELLTQKLAERAEIQPEEKGNLRKAGIVGAGMILLFVFGEHVHLLPAVTALMGATALLLWVRPDVEEMIEAVDWTTLVFYITLFIVIGAVQEVGLIAFMAQMIGGLVGQSLVLSALTVLWLGAILSTVIANVPFTAAMLPVIAYLTAIVPGAQNKVLFYCLSVGAAMGGNGSLIGSSANIVTAGISERAGYRITYAYFLKKGLPALFVTVGLSTLWLLLRFL